MGSISTCGDVHRSCLVYETCMGGVLVCKRCTGCGGDGLEPSERWFQLAKGMVFLDTQGSGRVLASPISSPLSSCFLALFLKGRLLLLRESDVHAFFTCMMASWGRLNDRGLA